MKITVGPVSLIFIIYFYLWALFVFFGNKNVLFFDDSNINSYVLERELSQIDE